MNLLKEATQPSKSRRRNPAVPKLVVAGLAVLGFVAYRSFVHRPASGTNASGTRWLVTPGGRQLGQVFSSYWNVWVYNPEVSVTVSVPKRGYIPASGTLFPDRAAAIRFAETL